MKILAVDDDPRIRRAVKTMLGEAGHEVVTVGDAASAFASILSERPDLFLLDINLPGMNGLTLAQKLQDQRGTQATPVVMLSARTDPMDKVVAYASGAVTYLEKPFKKTDLLDAVRTALEFTSRRRRR